MQATLQNSLQIDLNISKKSKFRKPDSWPDIRKNLVSNSIRLLADARYPLGFTTTVSGGYSVDIDGEHYNDYNSEAQFSMADWSEYTDSDGYPINYPTNATKAHIIDIYPQTEGAEITAFKHQRVDSSVSHEEQGTLWIHFNLSNVINLHQLCSPYPYNYKVDLLEAVTAKNNIINFDITKNNVGTFRANSLKYLPVLKNMRLDDTTFSNSKIDKVILDSPLLGRENNYTFSGCNQLKQIKIKNPSYYQSSNYYNYFAKNTMLKEFPPIDWTNVVGAYQMWSDYNRASNDGEPTIIDASAATRLQSLGIFDTNTLVGLRVSNQAPFSNVNSPQIDIHNTALDRTALVTLFNSLPTVSDGQIINITGTTGANDLTEDDKAIATDKGWTMTL